MQRAALIVIVTAALASACGAVPPAEIGIASVENVTCIDTAGEQKCSADVHMNVFLPEGVADQLTVVVSSPAVGGASLTGNTSGELPSSTWVQANGSAPTCEPGMATVYVSSMLSLPTGEITVDGTDFEAEVQCQ